MCWIRIGKTTWTRPELNPQPWFFNISESPRFPPMMSFVNHSILLSYQDVSSRSRRGNCTIQLEIKYHAFHTVYCTYNVSSQPVLCGAGPFPTGSGSLKLIAYRKLINIWFITAMFSTNCFWLVCRVRSIKARQIFGTDPYFGKKPVLPILSCELQYKCLLIKMQ